jgi:hypothetical protein
MAIDTKIKIQTGEVSLRKKSYTLVPQGNPTLRYGIDRNPDDKEGISGSIEGVNQVVVRNAGDLFYYTGNSYSGTDFIIHQLTVGCIYLIAGKATLNWPGTTVAHPSPKVQVARTATRSFLPGHETLFPFFVESGLWHGAIVPVLEDLSINIGETINKCVIAKNFEFYLSYVRDVLVASLREYGFIP